MKATVQPKNSDVQNGVRVYKWGDTECISVTSARTLLGTPHRLMNWKLNAIVDRALNEPIEFAVQAAMGEKAVRAWLREGIGNSNGRQTAAERGTVVHQAIELNLSPEQTIDEIAPYIVQYQRMKKAVGFDILMRERQVWNLNAGYAGTFDAVVRRHENKRRPDENVLVDWKTADEVYSDYVRQAHAYLAAEFVGNDGTIDEDATHLLHSTSRGAIAQILPGEWSWHEFDFDPEVLRVWMNSLAFARYEYLHPEPTFDWELKGKTK